MSYKNVDLLMKNKKKERTIEGIDGLEERRIVIKIKQTH